MLQDLQRRMDCTVGKPGTFIKSGQTRPMTVGVRLSRLENTSTAWVISDISGLTFAIVAINGGHRFKSSSKQSCSVVATAPTVEACADIP